MKAGQTPGPWDPEFPAVAQGPENEDMAEAGKVNRIAMTLRGSKPVKFVICTEFPLGEGVRVLSLSRSWMVFQAFRIALPALAFIQHHLSHAVSNNTR